MATNKTELTNGQDYMKSDSFDRTYTYSNSGGLVTTGSGTGLVQATDYKVVEKVEVLIKALGTMILMPEYESDPVVLGSKHFKGTVQMPILMDKNRQVAIDKLLELVNKL